MKFVGKAVIEVEIDAQNLLVAEQKFLADMKGTFNGVNKRILIRPILEERREEKD